MPPVISNTSPLIALADVGQFQLLQRMFGDVIIPPALRAEVLSEPALAEVQAALKAGWLRVTQPTEAGIILLLNETLEAGESEAIALAQETSPRWLIQDDLAARREAEALGLPTIGTLGVLLLAKEVGLLTSIKPVLDELRDRSLYIGEALYLAFLTSAGEAD